LLGWALPPAREEGPGTEILVGFTGGGVGAAKRWERLVVRAEKIRLVVFVGAAAVALVIFSFRAVFMGYAGVSFLAVTSLPRGAAVFPLP